MRLLMEIFPADANTAQILSPARAKDISIHIIRFFLSIYSLYLRILISFVQNRVFQLRYTPVQYHIKKHCIKQV